MLLFHSLLYLWDWWIFCPFLTLSCASFPILLIWNITCTRGENPHERREDSSFVLSISYSLTIIIRWSIHIELVRKKLVTLLQIGFAWRLMFWTTILCIIKLLKRNLALFATDYLWHFILKGHLYFHTACSRPVSLVQVYTVESSLLLIYWIPWYVALSFWPLSMNSFRI